MDLAKRFAVFSFASWLLMFGCTYLQNNVATDFMGIAVRQLNFTSQYAFWALQPFIVLWPLFFILGVKTWSKILIGGMLFGAYIGYSFYSRVLTNITYNHTWPARYWGFDLTDNLGQLTNWFFVFTAVWASIGFLAYSVAASLSKMVPESV
jgi:hypothetical protein